MAATLDDVVSALERLETLLEDIRDSGGGGGGAGGTGGGKIAATSGGAGGPLGLMGKGLKGGMGYISAGIQAARSVGDFAEGSGLAAGYAASMRGATSGQAVNMGGRALISNVLEFPGLSSLFANTSDTLAAQGRAQTSISGLAESVARAGGELDDNSIRSALGRQNEIEGRVTAARNRVANLQAEVGASDLSAAASKDRSGAADTFGPLLAAISPLTAAMVELTNLMRAKAATPIGGAR